MMSLKNWSLLIASTFLAIFSAHILPLQEIFTQRLCSLYCCSLLFSSQIGMPRTTFDSSRALVVRQDSKFILGSIYSRTRYSASDGSDRVKTPPVLRARDLFSWHSRPRPAGSLLRSSRDCAASASWMYRSLARAFCRSPRSGCRDTSDYPSLNVASSVFQPVGTHDRCDLHQHLYASRAEACCP